MKVFISWSGEISRNLALAFRDWLPSVINAIKPPYVSAEAETVGPLESRELARPNVRVVDH